MALKKPLAAKPWVSPIFRSSDRYRGGWFPKMFLGGQICSLDTRITSARKFEVFEKETDFLRMFFSPGKLPLFSRNNGLVENHVLNERELNVETKTPTDSTEP